MSQTNLQNPETPPPLAGPTPRGPWEAWAAVASSLVFLVGLGLFAYTGTFARFWADDYCYSAVTKGKGLWSGMMEWYLHSGNRFSSVAAVAVSDWFGPGAVAVLPPLLLGLMLAAWIFFLFQLRGLIKPSGGEHWLALLALLQVYFLALLAPDRLQTLYWRMGLLHYSLPLPLLLVQLALFARQMGRPRRAPIGLVAGLALLALFAAGNSETFAFLQLGLWGLALLSGAIVWRGTQRAGRLSLILAPLAGSLLALAIMFFSPQNADRLEVMPPPDNIWATIPVTVKHAAEFIYYIIRGQMTPFLVFLAGCAAVSWLWLRHRPLHLAPPRTALLGTALALAVTYTLVAASFFPSSYAGLQYPSGRALMPAAFVLLAGSAAAVFWAIHALAHLAGMGGRRWLSLAALALLLAVSLYPLRAWQAQGQEQARLATWAERWDQRDEIIRQSLAESRLDVEVRELEVVRSLQDIGPDPDFWINRCAALFYGARSVTANP